jgi:hypothetical protein
MAGTSSHQLILAKHFQSKHAIDMIGGAATSAWKMRH